MKKIAIFLLVFIMIFCYISPLLINANDKERADIEKLTNTVTYSCVYNPELSVIKISGTMSHDAMIKYKNYSLLIYKIEPGKDVESVVLDGSIDPIASSALSIKFQFSFEIKSVFDKFSRYAVLLKSPEGELILTDYPKYVLVEEKGNTQSSNRIAFKGILENSSNAAFDVLPGTVIIPIKINEAFSNIPKGYVYQNSFTQVYFSEEYINALDAKIKSVSAYGGKAYLQILVPSEITEWGFEGYDYSDAEYLLPNVYSEYVLVLLDAFASFMAERYNGGQTGKLSGMIIGKQIDLANKYNAYKADTLSSYANCYVDYLATFIISAKSLNSELEIILPFSSHNAYSKAKYETTGFSSAELLETIIKKFDESFDPNFRFNTLIESEALPLLIDDNGKVSVNEDNSFLTANNISVYDDYIKKLASKYDHVPEAYMYVWNIDPDLKGNELSLIYSFSYYKLRSTYLQNSTFVASFENSDNFSDVKNIIKYINEKSTLDHTKKVLDAFGIDDWNTLINDFEVGDIISHLGTRAEVIEDGSAEFTGEYTYFEVSEISTLANWVSGSLCKKMYIHPHDSLGCFVKADFSESLDMDGRGELYYVYEEAQSFLFTPYISFDLMSENNSNPDAIYEIGITFIGEGTNYAEAKYTLKNNELTRVTMDVAEFTVNNKVKTVRITTRELLGNNDNYSLLVKGMTGQSTDHTSKEIEALIFKEQVNIMNQGNNEEQRDPNSVSYGVVFAAIFAILGIGLGILVSLKKDTSD